MIREIEERSLNAWPALRQVLCDGWLLRFAGGYTRRANSVNALFPGRRPIEEKIAWCEEQYAAQGFPAIFKITPDTQPDSLDRVLDEKGYRREAETEVLYTPLPSLEAEAGAVELPLDEWLDAFCRVTGHSPEQRA